MQQFLNLTQNQKKEFLNSFGAKLDKVTLNNEIMYIVVFNDKTYENSNKFNDFIRSLRGLIFNDEGQIISRTYSVPYDVVNEKLDLDLYKLNCSKLEHSVEELIDGILLRLTYFDKIDKWVLSSNSKIFAEDKFYIKFNLCVNIEELTKKLNKNNIYLFILCDPDNSIIINYTRAKVYYVSTIDKSTGNELPLEDIHMNIHMNMNINIPYTYENSKINFNDEITSYVVKFKNGQRYRFESMSYTTLKLMRGKGPIEHKIINLIRYGNNNVIQVFLYNFPNHIPLFNELSKKIHELPNILYNLYVDRYITHKINYVNGPAKHKFLLEIHKTYISNTKCKIKLVNIVNKLFNIDVKILSSLLN